MDFWVFASTRPPTTTRGPAGAHCCSGNNNLNSPRRAQLKIDSTFSNVRARLKLEVKFVDTFSPHCGAETALGSVPVSHMILLGSIFVALLGLLAPVQAGCGIYQNGTMKMPMGFTHPGPLLRVSSNQPIVRCSASTSFSAV